MFAVQPARCSIPDKELSNSDLGPVFAIAKAPGLLCLTSKIESFAFPPSAAGAIAAREVFDLTHKLHAEAVELGALVSKSLSASAGPLVNLSRPERSVEPDPTLSFGT